MVSVTATLQSGACVRCFAYAVAYQEQCRYIISTRTGMMKGAGTDSHVFLTMVGSGGQSRRHLLDNSTENFTRGR